ncbi:MAG TPA: DUF2232 domain-containing protein [Gemmatimonadales bacterium]|nr:DUF2232 domain-containing protein [Gemmatimonadales bacterium]
MLYVWAAPPIFALGPLAVLLALSRPASSRERAWLLATVLLSLVWLAPVGGVADQVTRAAGVFLTAAFAAVSLLRLGGFPARAGLAVAAAAAATAVTCAAVGIGWGVVRRDVGRMALRFYRTLEETNAGGAPSERTAAMLDAMYALVDATASLFPGMLALWALAGLALAWSWHRRLASRPHGGPLGTLRDFRFSDHLVWGFVIALGLLLAGAPEPWRTGAANLLLVLGTLYAVRGAAVGAASFPRLPLPVVLGGMIGVILLLPLVVFGLLLLGLVDTWVDFRRHLPASRSGD